MTEFAVPESARQPDREDRTRVGALLRGDQRQVNPDAGAVHTLLRPSNEGRSRWTALGGTRWRSAA